MGGVNEIECRCIYLKVLLVFYNSWIYMYVIRKGTAS